MPDLKTALETALKDWECDSADSNQPKETKMKPQIFKPTNNVTRETFNFIQQNRGCSKGEVVRGLAQRGFKVHSVTSLVSQMVKQNFVSMDSSGGLHTLIPEYVPLKNNKTSKLKQVKAPKVKERVSQAPELVPVLEIKHSQSKSLTAQEILNKLNVVEAKALYKELTKVFEE